VKRRSWCIVFQGQTEEESVEKERGLLGKVFRKKEAKNALLSYGDGFDRH